MACVFVPHGSLSLVAGFLLLLLLVPAGCGSDSGPHFPGVLDKGGVRADGGSAACPQGPQQPTVVQPPQSACGDTVPVHGFAAPKTTVLVTGGATDVSAEPNATTNQYCVDVPLRQNQVNTLKIFSHDAVCGLSPAVQIKVSHTKCKDDGKDPPKDPPKSKNVALGMKPLASKTAEAGNETFLTDGDATTVAVYKGGGPWISADIWVQIKLEKITEVSKIVVKWRDKKGDSTAHYAKEYKVLVATGSSITDPNLKDGYWTQLRTITAGDGGIDTHDVSGQKPLAQYVALWLEFDDGGSWSETFAISEIEVWDVPKQQTTNPGDTKLTCASLGN